MSRCSDKMSQTCQRLHIVPSYNGRFAIVNDCGDVIQGNFKSMQTANAYIFGRFADGTEDHRRREAWWNAHLGFRKKVMELIKDIYEEDDKGKLTMRDAFHKTQKLARQLGIPDYTVKEWNHLANFRGKLSDWVAKHRDELDLTADFDIF